MFLKFISCKGFMSIFWCQWPQAIIWAITDQASLGYLNPLRPRQDGRRFADNVFKCIFLNENIWISLKISLKLFLRFQLTIFQHWFRYWLGAVQATSHYLNQWWLVSWHIYASLGLNEIYLILTLRLHEHHGSLNQQQPDFVQQLSFNSELGQHWFRQWLVTCSIPSHYLNQCWLVVNRPFAILL